MAKIIVDAALSKTVNKGAAAPVARDAAGIFLGSSSVTIDGISDVASLVKSVIQNSFGCCKIEVCLRTCNVSARCLAAFGVGMEQGSYQVWLDPFPV